MSTEGLQGETQRDEVDSPCANVITEGLQGEVVGSCYTGMNTEGVQHMDGEEEAETGSPCKTAEKLDQCESEQGQGPSCKRTDGNEASSIPGSPDCIVRRPSQRLLTLTAHEYQRLLIQSLPLLIRVLGHIGRQHGGEVRN
jgi:hypothetical protein